MGIGKRGPFLPSLRWWSMIVICGCTFIWAEDVNVARRQGWELALLLNGVSFVVVIAALLVSQLVLRSRRRARERQDLYRRMALALARLAEDQRPRP